MGCAADRKQSQRVNTFQMGEMDRHHHRNGMKMERKMDAPVSSLIHIEKFTYLFNKIEILFLVCQFSQRIIGSLYRGLGIICHCFSYCCCSGTN